MNLNMSEIDTNSNNNIFDVSEENFLEKVIENSEDQAVLVDFWAPWCEPCKKLTPVLEEVISECNGKALLAKINIDENQQVAAQLRIQSIPTILAFKNKKINNAFQGVLPKKNIIEFVEKVIGEKINEDNSAFYDEIKNLFEKKQYENAKESIEVFLSNNSNDVIAIGLYINCLTELSKYDEIKVFFEGLADELQNDDIIKSAISNYNLKEKNSNSDPLDEIKKKFEESPKNIENLIELSEKYFSDNYTKDAFELLLGNFLSWKDKDRQKIKKVLLKYFEALGNDNEHTKLYRKKLSSLMFS
tara:strand:- start:460 stop:1365 length:906 start_codon:yes stop_codon:yes gene_type:complete